MLSDDELFLKAGISAEQETVTKHFCYFGPVPEALFQQIQNDDWRKALQSAAKQATARMETHPQLRMSSWAAELGETALAMLSAMTNLDPRARSTIAQALAHPYWQEQEALDSGTSNGKGGG
jgi:hypothetical protein